MPVSDPPTAVDAIDDRTEFANSQVRISIFLGLLILTVFVLPSIGFGERHEKGYGLLVTVVLFCSGVSIAWRQKGFFYLSGLAAFVAVVATGCALWIPSYFWTLSGEIATIVSIVIIAWTLLAQIFQHEELTTPISIQAAIAVYLLFGAAWANGYLIAMQLNPHSFQSTVALSAASVNEWIYFSFVTLTTLGYGDIRPISQVARFLSIGEALTGQLYLAVLIAQLVGRRQTSGPGGR